MPRFREEVINVLFSELLTEYGLAANPETLTGKGRPDVLISMSGVKVVLEGRSGNEARLIQDAEGRVTDGLADIGLAVFYAPELSEAPSLEELREQLRQRRLSGHICHLDATGLAGRSFEDSSIPDLVEILNGVFRLIVQNDVLRDQVAQVSTAIEGAVESASEHGLFFESEAVLERLRNALGIEGES